VTTSQATSIENTPVVSVIVPCYNSAATIRRCLNSIFAQRTSFPLDVTVVDSSSDETPRIVEQEFPSARLIRFERRTFAGAARNAGVRATRSEFCLMIDSDCVAGEDLIERMIERHREGDYAAVGGSMANGTPRSLSGWIGYLLEFKEFMPATRKRMVTTVPTANVCYRRSVLERYGGFDEQMQFAEDISFNWEMCAAGEQILFDPAIEVVHLNRTGWRRVFSYQVGLGRYSARARMRNRMPGQAVIRHPLLIPAMPFVRTARAAAWLAANDGLAFLAFLAAWPFYFVGASFWSFGFFQEALERR